MQLGEALRFSNFRFVSEQFRTVVFQHPAAGTGGNNDRIVTGKGFKLMPGHLSGFFVGPRIVGLVGYGRIAVGGKRTARRERSQRHLPNLSALEVRA